MSMSYPEQKARLGRARSLSQFVDAAFVAAQRVVDPLQGGLPVPEDVEALEVAGQQLAAMVQALGAISSQARVDLAQAGKA